MDALFFLKAFMLFLAPGPTNALLLAGSVKRQKAVTLLLAQACGYGIAAACWFSLRSLMPPGTIHVLSLIAAAWLVVLGLRLMTSTRINVSTESDALSVLATSALNPKAFIYCLAIVPTDVAPRVPGIFWIVLLMITAATGSAWLLLGRRLGEDGGMADRVAGAALIAFALLLLRPLIAATAI